MMNLAHARRGERRRVLVDHLGQHLFRTLWGERTMGAGTARTGGQGALIATAQRYRQSFFNKGTTNSGAITTAAQRLSLNTPPVTDLDNGRYVFEPGSDNWLWFEFMGKGADGVGGAWGIWAWRELPPKNDSGKSLWTPHFLGNGEFVLTSTQKGIDGTPFDDQWLFADTITITNDHTYSVPGLTKEDQTNGVAWMFLDYVGAQLIEVELSITHATVTGASDVNALYWTT